MDPRHDRRATVSHKAKSKDPKSGTIHAKDKKKVKEDTAAMTKTRVQGAARGTKTRPGMTTWKTSPTGR